MRCKGIPIRTIKEFGNLYVTSMPTEITDFDELCEWARDEIDKATSSKKSYYTSARNNSRPLAIFQPISVFG